MAYVDNYTFSLRDRKPNQNHITSLDELQHLEKIMKDLIIKAYENNLPVVTRDGTKAEIVYIAQDYSIETYSVVIRCENHLETCTKDGLIYKDSESGWDIVGLWEEKTYPIGSVFGTVAGEVMLSKIQPGVFKLVSLVSGNRYSDRVVAGNKSLTKSEIDFLVEGRSWSYLGQFHEIYHRVPL